MHLVMVRNLESEVHEASVAFFDAFDFDETECLVNLLLGDTFFDLDCEHNKILVTFFDDLESVFLGAADAWLTFFTASGLDSLCETSMQNPLENV